MAITYTPTAWANGVAPAINAANLSNIENQLVALSAITPPAAYPFIGQTIFSELAITTSATAPVLDRSINQDISVANWPLAITPFRAVKTKVPSGSTTDHANIALVQATGVCTGAGTAWDQLVTLITNDAIAAGWLRGGQAATFAADYTSPYNRCLNIGGTDYAITAASPGGHTITVATAGLPANGNYTVICYTYRIAGSTTTCRLRGIPGFVPVAAGDVDGEVVEGWMKMDRFESHVHQASASAVAAAAGGSFTALSKSAGSAENTGVPLADGTNTLRTGKTTDPRTIGQRVYTWLGQYVP